MVSTVAGSTGEYAATAVDVDVDVVLAACAGVARKRAGATAVAATSRAVWRTARRMGLTGEPASRERDLGKG
jgi:hypothetical protein